MNNHIQYPRPVATNLLRAEIEYIANDVIREYRFDSEKTFTHDLASQIGGKVRFGLEHSIIKKEGSLSVHGPRDFEIRVPWGSGILRSNFFCAHQLGHYFLHSGKQAGTNPIQAMNYFNVETDDLQVEREANFFAHCLLMPREKFRKAYLENYTYPWGVCSVFNVSLKLAQARWEYINRTKY